MKFNLENESYDITPELRAIEILNARSSLSFSKNKNPYDIDVVVVNNNEIVGYVEIEHCRNWVGPDLPRNWYEISFLDRKIFNDKESIYLKFNKEFTNCFSITTSNLMCYGEFSVRNNKNSNLRSYNDEYVVLPIDSNYIIFGIDNSIKYIDSVIRRNK